MCRILTHVYRVVFIVDMRGISSLASQRECRDFAVDEVVGGACNLVDKVLQANSIHVEKELADVLFAQGYNQREFHDMVMIQEEFMKEHPGQPSSMRYQAKHARDTQNWKLDSMHAKKAEIQSMRDRERH